MKPEDHLAELLDQKNELLNQKNARIKELEAQIENLKCHVQNFLLPKDQTLPVPRLEMVVRSADAIKPCRWDYHLVYRHWTGDIIAVPLGQTTSWLPPMWPPRDRDGKLELPFRDGFHIRADATQLGLPAFIVSGDEAQSIESFPRCPTCAEIVHPGWLRGFGCDFCRKPA